MSQERGFRGSVAAAQSAGFCAKARGYWALLHNKNAQRILGAVGLAAEIGFELSVRF
jgi:hypothetical protein